MQFTDTLEMIDEIQYQVERHVQGLRRVTANDLGLDMRCGRAYVGENNDCIIVEGDARGFNYYGGFEYIDSEDKRTLGDYTVFLDTSERVRDALECLMEKDGLCDSDDGYEDRGLETCRD
jgi:hypothetical protein